MKAICKMNGLETTWPCTATGCPLFGDCLSGYVKKPEKKKSQTNGDWIRSLTDEELVEKLFQAYRAAVDWQEFSDLSMHWCDGKSGCVDADGNIECDEVRHKACILRWLKSEAQP